MLRPMLSLDMQDVLGYRQKQAGVERQLTLISVLKWASNLIEAQFGTAESIDICIFGEKKLSPNKTGGQRGL